MRDYNLLLKDIIAAIESIEQFVENMDIDTFRSDDKTNSAVVRKFEIIGEAAKGIPEEMKRNSPQILWKEMSGMRDKLIHFYFGVDYDLVWKTIQKRLPDLKMQIKKIMAEGD